MTPKYLIPLLFAAVLAGCGNGKEGQSFDTSKITRPHVDVPYSFKLPSEKTIRVTQHGRGTAAGDYAEISPFSLDSTYGKWQIWVAHNVWSSVDRTAHFTVRQRSISAFLSALYETKKQNNLDVEINFLQIDSIPQGWAMSEAKHTANMSLSPNGDVGCGKFWVECTDRYVISPFGRESTQGMLSQREWLMPIIKPKLDEVNELGRGSKYWDRAGLGVMDPKSEYWDFIYLTAFIVNPDGEVVDALAYSALGSQATPAGVIERFIVAADLDPDEVVKPIPGTVGGYTDAGYLDVLTPKAKFGGDFLQNAVDELNEILE